MRRIEYGLPADGHTVTVEVETAEEGGLGPVSRDGVPDQAQDSFQGALDRLGPVISSVFRSVRSAEVLPDEVKVELGVKFDAAAGIVISSVGVGANLNLTLTWKKKEGAPTAPLLP